MLLLGQGSSAYQGVRAVRRQHMHQHPDHACVHAFMCCQAIELCAGRIQPFSRQRQHLAAAIQQRCACCPPAEAGVVHQERARREGLSLFAVVFLHCSSRCGTFTCCVQVSDNPLSVRLNFAHQTGDQQQGTSGKGTEGASPCSVRCFVGLRC